mgnify:CR=1 FL=1
MSTTAYKIELAKRSLDQAMADGMDARIFVRAYVSWSRADKDLLAELLAEHAGFEWDADDRARLGI